MPNAAIQLNDMPEDRVITARSSGREIPEDVPELEARGQLHVLQNSTQGLRTAAKPEIKHPIRAGKYPPAEPVALFV